MALVLMNFDEKVFMSHVYFKVFNNFDFYKAYNIISVPAYQFS